LDLETLMRRFVLLLTLAVVACAQTTTTNSIQASGSATRNVKPDMAQLSIGVVTQATTADAAASQNATLTDSVIKAVQVKLGDNGTIQTQYYSISPVYASSNGRVTLTGYTVTNTLQVTVMNVALVGPLIDAANAAGANSISGPYFGLQNSEPEIQLALAAASKQALAHAAAIATGLGGKTGAVLSAQEGSVVRPVVDGSTAGAGAATATATPIQTGTVTVTAYVTVSVALVQ
jgi:uncharacterized protein YggE